MLSPSLCGNTTYATLRYAFTLLEYISVLAPHEKEPPKARAGRHFASLAPFRAAFAAAAKTVLAAALW